MDLQAFVFECKGLLGQLKSIANETLLARIEAMSDRLDRERLNILVVGEFSRGKSTFINALIGMPVLPSKVTPSTATINILSGGAHLHARIEFMDGRTQELELPSSGINKFLDQYVTTANADVGKIRLVRIQIPGRLDAFAVDIVDTPGVNDLDASREEVTYSYLRNADAAVLLLDAQQLLSESERHFLQDKVFANDVNRVLFVVNKIDEVLSGHADPAARAHAIAQDIPRIKSFIAERLREFVGLTNPRVFAVSAKTALAARSKNQIDAGPTSFDEFERELIAFASEQALGGRLTAQLDAMVMLTEAQQAIFESEADSLQVEAGSIQRKLLDLAERAALLDDARARIAPRIVRDAERLGTEIADLTAREVTSMRQELRSSLEKCQTDDDVEEFRGYLGKRVRTMIENVEGAARAQRSALVVGIERDFGKFLAMNPLETFTARSSAGQLTVGEIRHERAPEVPKDSFDLAETATGAGLGYLGASLFGPIGIAAAVFGSYWIAKGRGVTRAAALAKQDREAMQRKLSEVCAQLVDRASDLGAASAKSEAGALTSLVNDRLRRGMEVLEASASAARSAAEQDHATRTEQLSQLRTRMGSLRQVRQHLDALRGSRDATTLG